MQEKEAFCYQCQRPLSSPSNRLVQDSCGHRKCRSCLLEDVDRCKQCISATITNEKNGEKIKHPSKFTDNHTAVIQCNGKARLNCDTILEEVPDKRYDISISGNQNQDTNLLEGTFDPLQDQQKETGINKVWKGVAGKKKFINVPSHIILRQDPVSYLCTICNKTFFTKSHVKYHQYCAGEMKPFKCEVCEKEFILKVQLQIHMYKHGDVKPFNCSICQKSFSEKSKLARHMILHSSEKKYICPDCAKAFKSKESLKVHSLTHKEDKPFACKMCPMRFNNSSNLRKHLVSHSNEKAHMCDQCGRRFKLKWALSVHRKSHLRVRPHTCTVCSKNFVNFKDLQRHALVHSESKGYTCGICRTSFRRKDNLHRHTKNTHPGKKGEIIKNNVVKAAPALSKKPAAAAAAAVLVDNPNAIKVITASPAITKSMAEAAVAPPPQLLLRPQHTAKITDSRPTGSVINGPIKLASKTPAFKSYYNIARDCDYIPSTQITTSLPLAEAEQDQAQEISTLSEPFTITDTTDELTSQDIRQTISNTPISSTTSCPEEPKLKPPQPNLATYSTALHYETSFQYGRHAMIKNIKFKVPEQYTNLCKQSKRVSAGDNHDGQEVSENKVYSELKPVVNTSVIVNNSNSNQSSEVHWRRRTSQNLVLKN